MNKNGIRWIAGALGAFLLALAPSCVVVERTPRTAYYVAPGDTYQHHHHHDAVVVTPAAPVVAPRPAVVTP